MPYRARWCEQSQRSVRKFDHYCCWLGGPIGELNHRKFWLLCLFQTVSLYEVFKVARSGHRNATVLYPENENMKNHIQSVWLFFIGMAFVFMMFTGQLLAYHTYLILSGQTTWEHCSRDKITYLRLYQKGELPFFQGLIGNVQ
jgi:palmitoyltransferase